VIDWRPQGVIDWRPQGVSPRGRSLGETCKACLCCALLINPSDRSPCATRMPSWAAMCFLTKGIWSSSLVEGRS
jgi:hypothetical protein